MAQYTPPPKPKLIQQDIFNRDPLKAEQKKVERLASIGTRLAVAPYLFGAMAAAAGVIAFAVVCHNGGSLALRIGSTAATIGGVAIVFVVVRVALRSEQERLRKRLRLDLKGPARQGPPVSKLIGTNNPPPRYEGGEGFSD